MKKVWILEKFETNEDMVKTLSSLEQALEENRDKLDEEQMNRVICHHKKMIDENPEGMWIGWEGKTIYRQFCDVARDSLRRANKLHKSCKFRVIEAEIEDNAQYWSNYKFIKENEGVLRYLMATK